MPVSRGAIEDILIKHVLDPSKYSPAQPPPAQFSPQIQEPPSGRGRWRREAGAALGLSCRQLQDRQQSWGRAVYPSCLRGARVQEQKPQPEAPRPAQGMPKCTNTPLTCFHSHLVQLPRLWWGVVPAWHHGHDLGVSPSASSASPNPFLFHQQNREPQLHPQGQLPAVTVYSQDPVPHQVSPGCDTWSTPRRNCWGVPGIPICPGLVNETQGSATGGSPIYDPQEIGSFTTLKGLV